VIANDPWWPDDAPTTGAELEPEAAAAMAALLRRPLLTVEHDVDLLQYAVRHGDQLARWFAHTAGWRFTTHSHEGFVRLYKRRGDPPAGRVMLRGRDRPASKLVLTVLCLVCEQLWRQPEMEFTELQREIVAVCATEAEAGTLPGFHPVDAGGNQHGRANGYRLALVQALQLLEEWHVISSSDPLDVAAQDRGADMVIMARRERLNALLACPSPSLLPIDIGDPDSHVSALCGDESDLPDRASAHQRGERRRHTAMRLVLDEPVLAADADEESTRFLATPHGRRFALDAAADAGLVCVVRPDWWMVADPGGASSDIEFPLGRTQEHQAALLLLKEITERPDPSAPVTVEDAELWLGLQRAATPWWAARYDKPGATRRLARIAATVLTDVGILRCPMPDLWEPTGAVDFWQVDVSVSQNFDNRRDENEDPSNDDE